MTIKFQSRLQFQKLLFLMKWGEFSNFLVSLTILKGGKKLAA